MSPRVRNKWTLYKVYEEEKKEQQNEKIAEPIETPQLDQQSTQNQKHSNGTKAKKKPTDATGREKSITS